jgi:hypothetical protein
MEEDDDIEWPENPFDRPHRAEPESPDELLATIQFEGTPALQTVSFSDKRLQMIEGLIILSSMCTGVH